MSAAAGMLKQLEDGNPDNVEAAIGKLYEFIAKVDDQLGADRIDQDVHDSLVADTEGIIDGLREELDLLDEDLLDLLAAGV